MWGTSNQSVSSYTDVTLVWEADSGLRRYLYKVSRKLRGAFPRGRLRDRTFGLASARRYQKDPPPDGGTKGGRGAIGEKRSGPKKYLTIFCSYLMVLRMYTVMISL